MNIRSLLPYLSILCIIYAFYAFLSLGRILPLENRTVPYAASDPAATQRYAHYTIADESGEHELMRVPLRVRIGDEVLAADNRLYQIVRIEEDRAYARFIRRIKL